MIQNSTNQPKPLHQDQTFQSELHDSIVRLSTWLDKNDWRGYDTFDGLNATLLRPLTFNNKYLRIVLQQSVRRFIINLRPLLGISKSRSTKGMGFLAKGFLRLYVTSGDGRWRAKTEDALRWLMQNQSVGYSGACWGNHFDYQSRTGYIPKGAPTIVWTSLIGHAFLDAYEHFHCDDYLRVAVSACEHIVNDLKRFSEDGAVCLGYIPGDYSQVHNSNVLGASLLARIYSINGCESYRALAEMAVRYTCRHQRADGSWYYGEVTNQHWVDNFHTAYVLDSLKYYIDNTGDKRFEDSLTRGYHYWKDNFFLASGAPKYYNYKTLPLDIQCCSQAIDTLVFFKERDPDSLSLAAKVAKWTIENMQDRTGYFYYRRYSPWFVNKTATLHWGQATMLCALSGLHGMIRDGSTKTVYKGAVHEY